LRLSFGWRDVSDGLKKPSMIEPVDPFQGSELNRAVELRQRKISRGFAQYLIA
jgi:hypothetical protein